jgi:hypothetical protein
MAGAALPGRPRRVKPCHEIQRLYSTSRTAEGGWLPSPPAMGVAAPKGLAPLDPEKKPGLYAGLRAGLLTRPSGKGL